MVVLVVADTAVVSAGIGELATVSPILGGGGHREGTEENVLCAAAGKVYHGDEGELLAQVALFLVLGIVGVVVTAAAVQHVGPLVW